MVTSDLVMVTSGSVRFWLRDSWRRSSECLECQGRWCWGRSSPHGWLRCATDTAPHEPLDLPGSSREEGEEEMRRCPETPATFDHTLQQHSHIIYMYTDFPISCKYSVYKKSHHLGSQWIDRRRPSTAPGVPLNWWTHCHIDRPHGLHPMHSFFNIALNGMNY